jgi:hypothetical protein
MIYQDLYWNAALIYLAGALGFWLVVWKVGTKLPWRPLRWWLTWLYFCVIFTPLKFTDPEVFYAPAIIVAAFDFLDVGMTHSLALLRPMINAIIAGTTVIVFIAIILKIRQLKANRIPSDTDADPESAA